MRRRAGAVAVGAIAVAIAASLACRQIVDFPGEPAALAQTGPDASADAGPNAHVACGLGYGTSRCASCVSASCCKESLACAADPACAPYAACAGACAGDPACRAQCTLDAPPGNSSKGPALTACLATECEPGCGLACGSLDTRAVKPDAAAACQSCLVANGCEAAQACGASADCDAYRLCRSACSANDCKEACDRAHDAGLALDPLTPSVCKGACATGADWSCVGQVSWPGPKSDAVTMTIDVKDYLELSPLAGVDVSVCDGKDVDCASPKAGPATTDAAGRVVLSFSNPRDLKSLGLDGFVQLQSAETTAEKIVPWLYYWGFPLSESEFELVDNPSWNLAIEVQTPDEAMRLATSVGLPYDPNSSYLIAFPLDCYPHSPPGVHISTDPSYLTVPEVYGLDETLTFTDANGFATFAGLPAGKIDVVATPLALGKPSSRETVNIRPGWVTIASLPPTP